jgi:hypothetical protein
MMEVQKFINTLSDKSPDSIRSNIYKRGILSNYSDDGRMVFYSSKNQRFNTSDLLTLECNGLVLDISTNNPLVIPQLLYKSDIDINVVNNHLSNDLYDIFCIEDGTTINFYYWNKMWCISTARSYDLTDKKWGSLTYKEVVQSILGESTKQFYESLDKNKCYTFGFKHVDLHPFMGGDVNVVNKIWFIQSVVINDSVNNESFGKINYEFINNNQIIHQESFNKNLINVKNLFPILKNSLNDFINNKIVNYGFMLRSKDSNKTNEYSNILLESSLLQAIRKLYYQSSFNNISKELGYDRSIYILINAYLNINRQSLFIKIFPQYLLNFNKLNLITTDIVTSIMCHMTHNNFDMNYETNVDKELLKTTAETLYNTINLQYKLNIDDKNLTRIITTYLLNNKWNILYYKLYTSINE